jgi:hypothetical protein
MNENDYSFVTVKSMEKAVNQLGSEEMAAHPEMHELVSKITEAMKASDLVAYFLKQLIRNAGKQGELTKNVLTAAIAFTSGVNVGINITLNEEKERYDGKS